MVDQGLAKAEGLCITLLLSLMILLSFGQVILRNFFDSGIIWGDIFLRQLVLWVGFLGASLAVRSRRHISIDFLPNVLPSSWSPWIRCFSNFCAGIITAVLTFSAWTFVQYEREAESTLFLDLPVWAFQVVLPYSFLIISLRFLLNAWDDLLTSLKADQ